MGRPPRADEANGIYHMLNRGNRREPLFHKTEDFEAFERMMVEAIERSRIKLYAYCLMPNHWHLVVSPEVDGEMGRFGQWLDLTHTQRHHAHITPPETVTCIRADSSRSPSRMMITFSLSAGMWSGMLTRRVCATRQTNGDLAVCGGGRTAQRRKSRSWRRGRYPGAPIGLISSRLRSPTRSRRKCNDRFPGACPSATRRGSRKRSDVSVWNRHFTLVGGQRNCLNPHNGT